MGSGGYSQHRRQSLAGNKGGIYAICQRLVQSFKEMRSCGKIAFSAFPRGKEHYCYYYKPLLPLLLWNKRCHSIVSWYLCDRSYHKLRFPEYSSPVTLCSYHTSMQHRQTAPQEDKPSTTCQWDHLPQTRLYSELAQGNQSKNRLIQQVPLDLLA